MRVAVAERVRVAVAERVRVAVAEMDALGVGETAGVPVADLASPTSSSDCGVADGDAVPVGVSEGRKSARGKTRVLPAP